MQNANVLQRGNRVFEQSAVCKKGRLMKSSMFYLRAAVKEFYARDDVSRITAGKKNCH